LSFPIPANEANRLVALRSFDILDSAPELAYDEIVELAAQICGCAVACINFIDGDRRWIKAKYGLPAATSEAPRGAAVCSTTICGTDLFAVPDMTQDPRFELSPLVVGSPHCRFYCGMPLITDDGYALGSLCVMDVEPRELSLEQRESLRRLSRQVLAQLELRRQLIEHGRTIKELEQAREEAASEKARAERERTIDKTAKQTMLIGRGGVRQVCYRGGHVLRLRACPQSRHRQDGEELTLRQCRLLAIADSLVRFGCISESLRAGLRLTAHPNQRCRDALCT